MSCLTQQSVQEAVARHLEPAQNLCVQLKAQPELAYQELESSRKMVELLTAAGYQVEYPFMQEELGYASAFRAVLQNGEGPTVAILAEYDALPVLGHACGHNLHGALSILTGLALSGLRDQFQGRVEIIGTPAEEENGAKVTMADHGVFDGMALAAMMHSWSGASQPNMDVLSLRCYVVEFTGAQAHAVAGPWQGHSALAAARKFLDLIDARRECFTPDMHVNSIIQNGGLAPNILPAYAKLRMEFRTSSKAGLEALDDTVRKCANGAAMALDCSVQFTPGLLDFADMVRVDTLEQEVAALLKAQGGLVDPVSPPNGSSDVGNVSYHCPTIQPLLSILDTPCALHTAAFRDATDTPRAFQALEAGAQVLTQLTLRTMNDAAFRQQVQQDFEAQRHLKMHP